MLQFLSSSDMLKSFRFDEHVTPVSSGKLMLSVCIAYLLGIIGLQKIMEKREAIQNLKYVIGIHNGLLMVSSFLLAILVGDNIMEKIRVNGLFWAVCSKDSVVGSLEFYCYINYLLKFYELLDTVFLVLKKKDIPFLHIYHHTLTLILTHVQLQGRTAVQWVPIILNLGVHSFMYCYYMIATFGYSVWWKKHLTTLQILQFVLDLIFCFYAFTIGWFSNYQDCAGDGFCAFVGITLISSYLLLFIDFFIETYQKSGSTKAENTSREKQKRS